MIFTNIYTLSILLFVVTLVIIVYYLSYAFRSKTGIFEKIFLSVSVILVSFSLFGVKGGLDEKSQEVYGSRVLFALDVSKSMKALDYKDGNSIFSRLNIAKNAIYESLVHGNEYGLIIFSGESLEVLPFSSDLGLFKTIVSGVDDKNMSKHGTSLGGLFLSIADFFTPEDEGGLVVILTDGGDEDENIDSNIVEMLKSKNIKIVFVGIGNKVGSHIPEGRDFFGNIVYKTYEGKRVVTQLNEKKLQSLSGKYNFDYFGLEDIDDISSLKYLLSKRLDFITIEKELDSRQDLTRFIIFFSFIFFILYLVFSQFLGKRN